jgi:hypothetical protein
MVAQKCVGGSASSRGFGRHRGGTPGQPRAVARRSILADHRNIFNRSAERSRHPGVLPRRQGLPGGCWKATKRMADGRGMTGAPAMVKRFAALRRTRVGKVHRDHVLTLLDLSQAPLTSGITRYRPESTKASRHLFAHMHHFLVPPLKGFWRRHHGGTIKPRTTAAKLSAIPFSHRSLGVPRTPGNH